MWILVLVGICLAINIINRLVEAVEARRVRNEKIARENKACRHGVFGAYLHAERCVSCARENSLQEEQKRRDAQYKANQIAMMRKAHSDEWRAKMRIPEYLRKLHPKKFEEVVAGAYEQLGYRVELTQYVGDGGVDAFLWRDGKQLLLQCKRVQGSVGEPVLRDLCGAMVHNQAHGGIVVTTGRVSEQARRWVRNKNIEIVELEDLQKILASAYPDGNFVPNSFVVQDKPPDQCPSPNCAGKLVFRWGKNGKFWGCTSYPECRYAKKFR